MATDLTDLVIPPTSPSRRFPSYSSPVFFLSASPPFSLLSLPSLSTSSLSLSLSIPFYICASAFAPTPSATATATAHDAAASRERSA